MSFMVSDQYVARLMGCRVELKPDLVRFRARPYGHSSLMVGGSHRQLGSCWTNVFISDLVGNYPTNVSDWEIVLWPRFATLLPVYMESKTIKAIIAYK